MKHSDGDGAGDKTKGRNLPSWMSSKASSEKQGRKKSVDVEMHEEDDEKTMKCGEESSSSSTLSFSKLLEGVVFVLSGFVNPERSNLRSQAIEMGGEYQPDWNSDCTLLICAFTNTPKFRQVAAECGTIVSKEWISECYNQKKLVAIEPYLMHVGKPWRRVLADHEITFPPKPRKQVERSQLQKPSVAAASSECGSVKELLSPSKVKKWATDDLKETISWLESQEERPEPSEVKKIATEGILTCLQDAIESLEQNQDIQQMTEQWKFIPRVVKELARIEEASRSKQSVQRQDICQQAITCKRIYEMAFDRSGDDSTMTKKKKRVGEEDETSRKIGARAADNACDSDETIEMTEEEIDLAYNAVVSKLRKW